MTAWYNEIDPFAANWLRELMKAGHIEAGTVEESPIESLNEVADRRAHFFAGIGGWDYALQIAGWPADRPVWTGSCPCQPFSVAGKRAGGDDPRHLWPAWFRLIRQHRPDTIFGEQVAGAIGHGWLDGVFTDLEAEGYTCGAVVLGAHSVGAAHKRQRVYWVANAGGKGIPRFIKKGGSLRRVESKASTVYSNGGIYEGFWPATDSLPPVETHGLPRPVGIVRAYGNAIVPQVAAAFVRAYMESGR